MNKQIRFGNNLKLLRIQNGESQQQLAISIHVSRQTISKWESSAGKPDIYYAHDICKHFGISMEKLLYGYVLSDIEIVESFEDTNEYVQCIRGYNKQGFYTILDEDLENYFEIIRYDLEKISVITLALHHQGYHIVELFSNGFSIFLNSDDEAVRFQKDLYCILDSFIHHDNEYVEIKCQEIGDVLEDAADKVINDVMEEMLGTRLDNFRYYWVDELENTRGYANSEEECMQQAKKQSCDQYTILPIV